MQGYDPASGRPCDGVTVGLPSLTVDKTSPDLTRAEVGDVVSYTVSVTNDGRGDYTASSPAVLVDDLTAVLDDATYNDDADARPAVGSVSYAAPRLVWTGPLPAGETVRLGYTVTVTGGGDLRMRNLAFVPDGRCVDAADCPAPPEPECPVDMADLRSARTDVSPLHTALRQFEPAVSYGTCAEVDGGIPRLELDKAASATRAVRDGDTVTYEITATNTGAGAYTDARPASFVDDLSGVLDDATYNDDHEIVEGGGRLTFSAPRLVWSGPIGVGAAVTVRYSVTITGGGDRTARNIVFSPTDPCEDSDDCVPRPPRRCVDGVDPRAGLPCDGVDLVVVPGPEPGGPELPETGAPRGVRGLLVLALLLLAAGAYAAARGRRGPTV